MKTITMPLKEYEALLEENKSLRESFGKQFTISQSGLRVWSEEHFFASKEDMDNNLKIRAIHFAKRGDRLQQEVFQLKEQLEGTRSIPLLFGYKLVK